MAASRKTFSTVNGYIRSFPSEVRKKLEQLQETIKETAPGAEETISYGIPTFDLHGRHLVHFAAFRHHIGFYPTPSAIEAFKDELSPYHLSRGTVQFPIDAPLPLDLVQRMVAFRVREVAEEKRKR
jgi:uncharacterized protein YdhG (YjbR/CyaY superfamily)